MTPSDHPRTSSTPVTAPAARRPPRWLQRAGYGALASSSLYAVLGVFWTAGGAGFPFGRHDPDAAASLLMRAEPGTAGPVIAAVGAIGAVTASVVARRLARPTGAGAGRLSPLTVAAFCLAVTATLVIPDYRPLLAVVRAPVLLVGAPFGWPRDVDLGEFVALYLPWPVVNQILLMLGGACWAAVAVGSRRYDRGACLRCGRLPGGAAAKSAAVAVRWGARAVAVAVAIPVFYALTRWSFALGVPLGVARDGVVRQAQEMPGIWLAGAVLATMAAAGATLTVGLVRPWGRVYPRWIPWLGGSAVRPRTAILPALTAAVLVTSAGLMYLRRLVLGQITLTADTWGLYVPELFWPLWGGALALAAYGYHLRRRGRCSACGGR